MRHPTLADLRLVERIHRGSSSLVYRALTHDGRRRIVKLLGAERPLPEQIARFRREHQMLRHLADVDGVVDAIALRCEKQRWFLVQDDLGGTSLDLLWTGRRLPAAEVLPLAARLAEILGAIHARGVIHKDINPSNLVIEPTSKQLQIIDFGIASRLRRESPHAREPSHLEGTLTSIAPEQTGRTGWSVDERADFYGLGVTLYALLAGRLPFESTDPLDLLHGHLARRPKPLDELVPDLDPRLSAIVLRLLAKNPEDRYQSAHGLRHDLLACTEPASRRTFALGARDVPTRLRLPQRLYGREHELERLLSAFDRAVRGERALALVAGYAGIGKSSLVGELRQPVTARGGFFVGGKFGHLERHVPYAPWIDAFHGLLDQILALGTDRLDTYRRNLGAALGRTARVLTDVVPELTALLGELPPVPELGPAATRNRFQLTVQRFLAALTADGHPLVLFFDDVQWADTSSLELLETLLDDSLSSHLLVVAAYRRRTIGDEHPLRRILSHLRHSAAGVSLEHLELQPLSADDVADMLAEALATQPERTRPLAGVVSSKCNGNPFFLGRLLDQLAAEGLLRFDAEVGAWTWDTDDIASCALTENVASLLADTVHALAPPTREMLELAACVGDHFDLGTLSIIAEAPGHTIAGRLGEALERELVVPLDERYTLADFEVDGLDLGTVSYRFVHDRVRQAAYAGIDGAERQRVHWRIGRLLHDQTPAARYDERLFDIVDQFGLGLRFGLDHATEAERDMAAALHLRAGRKARMAAAHQAAFVFLRRGIFLLSARSSGDARWPSREALAGAWSRRPELSLDLFATAAEAALVAGGEHDLELLLSVAREHVSSNVLQARLTSIELQALVTRGALDRALDTGLATLRQLGVELPRTPTAAAQRRAADELDEALSSCDLDAMADAPAMRDPRALAAMEVGAHLQEAAIQRDLVGLRNMVTIQLTLLCLRHGPSAYAPRCLAGTGLLYCSQAEIGRALALGHLSTKLARRFDDKDMPRALIFNLGFRFPREEPIARALGRWPDAYEHALQAGDHAVAANVLVLWQFWLLAFGGDLRLLAERFGKATRSLPHTTSKDVEFRNVFRALAEGLQRDDTSDAMDRVLEIFTTVRKSDIVRRALLSILDWAELIVRTIARADDLEFMRGCFERIETTGRGLALEAVHAFYGALCLLRPASPATPLDEDDTHRVARCLESLEIWAAAQPSFSHKPRLVAAELARATGEESEARDLYDEAILLARENGFVHEEALAHELAAGFHRARGCAHLARNYLRDAHAAYRLWGAAAKARQLEDRYPHELAQPAPRAHSRDGSRPASADDATREALDLRTVLEASQALSVELDLDKLLVRLLTTVLSSAGAERAIVLREQPGQDGWMVDAEAEARSGDQGPAVSVGAPIPLARYDRVLASVVHRVARTGEAQVIDDAAVERSTAEPDASEARPRSVLCMPLANKGHRSAILYLENNLVPGAFHPDRVELLELLAAQMAITLENARLYRDLEAANRELDRRVRERTRDLAERNRELHDTVERLHQTREQLVHREKMAALGRLSAGVAHEIRNPLNFVTNFARLSREAAAEALDGPANGERSELLRELRDNARLIEDHGRRAARIVDGMLLQARGPDEERRPTDVNQLVEYAVELVRHSLRAGESDLPAVVETDYDEAAGTIEAFPQELLRVVVNLLENAFDSIRAAIHREVGSSRSGNRSASILVRTEAAEDRVTLRVRDTGLGLAPEHADKIFEPFFTTKPPGEGTGLGLSMSYEAVLKHGGTMSADGREGEFAELRVVLPRAATPPLAAG